MDFWSVNPLVRDGIKGFTSGDLGSVRRDYEVRTWCTQILYGANYTNYNTIVDL